MDQYLEERGVDPAYARNSGHRAVEETVAKAMKLFPAQAGILIPYFDPSTGQRIDTVRIRYFDPPTIDGKVRRFTQPKKTGDSGVEAYFDPQQDWKPVLSSPKTDLYITEGEVKALAAILAGFLTVAIGGVDNYGGEQLTPLLQKVKWKGRHVYLVYDSDIKANEHVRNAQKKFAKILARLGAVVHLVPIPDWKPGGKTGLDDFLKLAGPGAFNALCAASPIYDVRAEYKPDLQNMSEVEAMTIEWLWESYLPLGTISALSGDPGSGKTMLALSIAASLSTGHEPYTKRKCAPVNTLYFTNENDPARVTKPRFVSMGGDPARLYTLNDIVTLEDVDKIEAAIRACKAKLVVFDPLQEYLRGERLDMNQANETRPVLSAILKLAERTGTCILFIRHLAKAAGGRGIHKGLGSVDITATLRVEMFVGFKADHPATKVLIPVKSNYGVFPAHLAFEVLNATPEIDGKQIQTGNLKWIGESTVTLADILAPEKKSGEKPKSQPELAADYLRDELKNGPRLHSELLEDSDFSQKTLRKAAKLVRVVKRRTEENGPWTWELPKPGKFTVGAARHKNEEEADSPHT